MNFYSFIFIQFIVGIFFISVLTNDNVQKQNDIQLLEIGPIEGVELEEDWSYRRFRANDNFLIWYEGYRKIIYVYNIETQKLNTIELIEGRGPNEVARLSDLYISSDDIIYIADVENIKFVRYKPNGEKLNDITPPPGVMPLRFAGNMEFEVLMEPMSPDHVFWMRQTGTEQFVSIEMEGSALEAYPTPFHRDGWFTIHGSDLIHLPRYYPTLYVYDLSLGKQRKQVGYDLSKVQVLDSVTDSEGNRVMLPPTSVDVLNLDIQPVPGMSSRILMLSDGVSENRSYHLDRLYEYDYEEELFVNEHKLAYKINEIVISREYLFAYSEEVNMIYKYQIVLNEKD